jgi:two-component system LytT family sensor kinase
MEKKCFHDVVGFNDRWIIIFGLPIASLLISLLLFPDTYEQGDWSYLSICIPMSFAYTGLFWYALRWAYKHVRERFPTVEDLGKRIFWMAIFLVVVYILVNYSLDAFFKWLLPGHNTRKPSHVVEFITTLLMSAFILTLYEALSFYLQLQRATAEKADLERKNVESQLEGLRNQVNPHFLFNSLNTLIYLIPEDPNKAVRFVQQLSKVYRYVLECREDKIIPLSEELEYLKSYVFLLKERFGENLIVEISDMEALRDLAIVPLSLQMLFENVIKHNIISTEKPLTIEVFAGQAGRQNGHMNGVEPGKNGIDTLIVRNNLQRKNQVMDSTGVGLENIRARYRMLTDRPVETIISQQYFTVALPLVALQQA